MTNRKINKFGEKRLIGKIKVGEKWLSFSQVTIPPVIYRGIDIFVKS